MKGPVLRAALGHIVSMRCYDEPKVRLEGRSLLMGFSGSCPNHLHRY